MNKKLKLEYFENAVSLVLLSFLYIITMIGVVKVIY